MKNDDIQLRVATEADAEFIYRVVETTMRGYIEQVWDSFSEEYNRRQIADTMQKANYSVIQYHGEEIGALSVERHPTHITLGQIYILPKHQNKRIGTYLVRKLSEESREVNKPLRLRVLVVNPAKRLYEREGFRVISTTPEFFFMELRA